MKKNTKKAFTLAEVMVTLALVSVISSILVPAIMQVKPDRNKLLFKKAYTTVEKIVTEIVNDDNLYPIVSGSTGLDNITAVNLNDKTYSGASKFCELFALKLNIVENAANCAAGAKSFTTNDGIIWKMPITTFATEAEIEVDINGNKAPNCKYNVSTCIEPDTFIVKVAPDGGISVDGVRELIYLRSNETIIR